MATIILEPNEEFAHTHATESRSQCLRGEVSVVCNGTERTLGVGETAVIPAGLEHVIRNIGRDSAYIGCAHSPRRVAPG